MNIRKIYVVLIVLLSMGLFYEWTSENRSAVQLKHMELVDVLARDSLYSSGDEYIFLENDLLEIKIAIATGAIVESRLKKYGVENITGSLGVRVFGSDDRGVFKYYLKTGFTGSSSSKGFSLASYGKDYVELFDAENGYRKRFSFLPASYEVQIEDISERGSGGKAFASMYRTEGMALDLKTNFSDGGMMNSSSYQGVGFNTSSDGYVKSRLSGIDDPVSVSSRSGWISFIQKYFFAALIGSDDYVYNYFAQPASDGVYRMGYTVDKSETQNLVFKHSHRVFIGPKIRKDLASRAKNLELTIEMGWFWFISQPMVWFLDFLNGFVNSWALSIVLFTLLLKIALFGVTAKGFASMAKMRKVGPKMKEISERHKDDRQRLQKEMADLQKKEGFNPLGGCLPVLVQMPVFIGFFFALREMVELRHAPMGLWISDLSVPDPVFVLPIMFVGIMVLTQRLNPAPPTSDPTQAQVMQYMPVMFGVFFLFFPAGLCLYSVVNSGVSLVQQRYLYRKLGALESGI